MSDLARFEWPAVRIGEAIILLARSHGLPIRAVDLPRTADVERAVAWMGLEAEPIEVTYPEVDGLLRSSGPALLRTGDDGWVALVGVRSGEARVVALDLSTRMVPIATLRRSLVAPLEAGVAGEIERMLDAAAIPARRRRRVRDALLERRLGAARVTGSFIVRLPPSAGFRRQMTRAGVRRHLAALASAHGARYALFTLGWWLIGRGALDGRVDPGWLAAWALVLFTQVPLMALTSWSQGLAAIEVGGLLKQRLLAGALELALDDVRDEGAGRLLGRVLESDAVEALALGAGFTAVTAAIELLVAGAVIAAGAGGGFHVAALLAWTVATGLIAWRYLGQRRTWTDARLAMTHDLVERMLGHRTRLAQQQPERWHHGEDETLERYIDLSRRMDQKEATLHALLPRGWLLLGVLSLLPAFVEASASPALLAVALGGTLLAYRALGQLVRGLAGLCGAVISWRTVEPLFEAASKCAVPATASAGHGAPGSTGLVLDAERLLYRYGRREHPVLEDCSLRVEPGDRVLLLGGSGSGKSTLGAVLSGARDPDAGLLLIGGLDKKTLGLDGWRRHVASAPQFHDNHVLSGTFAFNLLMGRRWPPHAEDLEAAETICAELGLGPLLERMPAGLQQTVGETGWQLSHGERSRVFIARALLQDADVLVLDESFAALDPQTLRVALGCVLGRAKSLIVIAHP